MMALQGMPHDMPFTDLFAALRSSLQPVLPDSDSAGPFTVNADEWRLLSALWSQHASGVDCAALDLDPNTVLHLARSLIQRGLLTEVAKQEPLGSAVSAPEQTQTAMDIPVRALSAHTHPADSQSALRQAVMRRVRAS